MFVLKSPLVFGSILMDRFAMLVDLAFNEAAFNERVNDDLLDRLGLPTSTRRAPAFVPPSAVGGES